MAKNKAILTGGIAVAAVVVLAGGGWLVAGKMASAQARTEVDSYVARNNLQDKVRMAEVTATPFGDATIHGMSIAAGPSTTMTIGTLKLSDIIRQGDRLLAIRVVAEDVVMPLEGAVKDNLISAGSVQPLLALGDKEARGNLNFAYAYDPAQSTLSLSEEGTARHAGALNFSIRLVQVPAAVMDALYSAPEAGRTGGAMALMMLGMQVMQSAGPLALAELTFSVDNGPLRRRQPASAVAAPPVVSAETGTRQLMAAGMPEAQARTAAQAGESWLKEGGTLRLATHLDAPLPLLRPNPGNRFMPMAPVFDSPQSFLALTKATVTR
jgi:hypothetical protein